RPRSTGSSTSTPPGPRSTSTTWAGTPTWSSGRPTTAGTGASGRTPRRRPRRSWPRPTGCARRRPRPGPRWAWSAGPSGCWPDAGMVVEGHGLRLGYYAQEHETLDPERTVLDNMRAAAPDADVSVLRGTLGSFLFSGDAVQQPARTLSGGEKTRLALAVLVVS